MFIWLNLHLPWLQYILHLDEDWSRRTNLSPVARNSHICDMFGYTRRGAEIRPSGCDGVAPMNPTPSTSHQGGITNGSLQNAQSLAL